MTLAEFFSKQGERDAKPKRRNCRLSQKRTLAQMFAEGPGSKHCKLSQKTEPPKPDGPNFEKLEARFGLKPGEAKRLMDEVAAEQEAKKPTAKKKPSQAPAKSFYLSDPVTPAAFTMRPDLLGKLPEGRPPCIPSDLPRKSGQLFSVTAGQDDRLKWTPIDN